MTLLHDAHQPAAARDDLPQLLCAVAGRLGVKIEAAAPYPLLDLKDASEPCRACPNRGACRAWLAGRGSRGDYRRFCPNADTLGKLARAYAATRASGYRPDEDYEVGKFTWPV